MGRVDLPVRFHVAFGAAIEDDERVDGIVINGIDAAVLGIDVQAALKFDLRIQAGNNSLGFAELGVRRRIFQAVIDKNLKEILIRHDDLIIDRVDRNGTESRVRVMNPTDWLQL